MKLLFPNSVLGPVTFADHYIFNCTETMPLHTIVYIGGGISAEEYCGRRETEPVVVRDLVGRLSDAMEKPLQLVVLSSPPVIFERWQAEAKTEGTSGGIAAAAEVAKTTGTGNDCAPAGKRGQARLRCAPLEPVPVFQEEGGEMIRAHFHHELMPAVGIRGFTLSLVGYSFGAYLATRIAVSLGESLRALACLGGVGMSEALDLGLPKGRDLMKKRAAVACFSNLDDSNHSYSEAFEQQCRGLGIRSTATRRHGGHPFDDYLMNGSLEAAFRFAAMNSQANINGGIDERSEY